MRLIDADALKEKLLKERNAIPTTYTERYGFGVEFPYRHGQSMRGGIKKALRCMEQTPTIDAVPVVRCKDCIHGTAFGEDFNCRIYPEWYWFKGDHFCADGERSEDV